MSLASAFSNTFALSHPLRVLERSLKKGRLAHAILLYGVSLDALEEVALALAGTLLNSPAKVAQHPDLFVLRPSHKAQQIRIEKIRELIRRIQHSPHQGSRKVALIYEANRMNNAAANAFLKTLEDTPTNTTILLLSTRPYDLLDTIRSRCFSYRLPADFVCFQDSGWVAWLQDYKSWLGELRGGAESKRQKAELIFVLYGLIIRFQSLLKQFTDTAWKKERETLSYTLSDEEIEACEAGLRKSVQQRLFAEIELHTRHFALATDASIDQSLTRSLSRAVADLERAARLLQVNLNESVALEYFLLTSLRTWTTG